ncbi:hypothetical protein HUJ04_004374 [Dendroctonus ponderosae]|nr:hypothetical protein HUJ04_004374 [Dendroctonus ponderosae]
MGELSSMAHESLLSLPSSDDTVLSLKLLEFGDFASNECLYFDFYLPLLENRHQKRHLIHVNVFLHGLRGLSVLPLLLNAQVSDQTQKTCGVEVCRTTTPLLGYVLLASPSVGPFRSVLRIDELTLAQFIRWLPQFEKSSTGHGQRWLKKKMVVQSGNNAAVWHQGSVKPREIDQEFSERRCCPAKFNGK